MNQGINKKLLVFTRILLFHFILFNSGCSKYTKTPDPGKTNPASSKIIYTDVNPDTAIGLNQSYNLDMNKDGITDFIFQFVRQYGSISCPEEGGEMTTIFITPAGGNNAIMIKNSGHVVLGLDSSWAVAPDSLWSADSAVVRISYSIRSCGTTQNYSFGDKYLGLRLTKDGITYYGWARINSYCYYNIQCMIILKDYAYNSLSNQPIYAGQTK